LVMEACAYLRHFGARLALAAAAASVAGAERRPTLRELDAAGCVARLAAAPLDLRQRRRGVHALLQKLQPKAAQRCAHYVNCTALEGGVCGLYIRGT
jgi:hypothetical protein